MKRVLSILLIMALAFSIFSGINMPVYASSNSKIAARIVERAENLNETIMEAKENERYHYFGYRGVKLTVKGQKCVDMASLIGLISEGLSDYYAEPVPRKEFAILMMRILGTLTSQSNDEMVKAYGKRKMSDSNCVEAGMCLSLGIMKNSSADAFNPTGLTTGKDAADAFWKLAILTGAVNGNSENEDSMSNLRKLKDPYLSTYVMNNSEEELYTDTYFCKEAALVLGLRTFDAIVGAYAKKVDEGNVPTPTHTPTPTSTPVPTKEITPTPPTLTPTPTITVAPEYPIPSPRPMEDKNVGKRINGDKKPKIDLGKKFRDNPKFIEKSYGPVAESKNMNLTKEILEKIKTGNMGFEISFLPNGKMKEIAKYWGTKAQLEKYVDTLFKANGVTKIKRDFVNTVSFFYAGNDLGRLMEATCGRPLVLGKKNMLAFSNEESAKRGILNTTLHTWIPNMGRTFKLNPALNLKNLEEKTRGANEFMVIDSDQCLIGCYFKEKMDAKAGQSEGCWVLKADADPSGKFLYLDGYLTTSHSSGVRNVFETHYVVSVE